jgi:glycerol uptake facilitator-like aquaporin
MENRRSTTTLYQKFVKSVCCGFFCLYLQIFHLDSTCREGTLMGAFWGEVIITMLIIVFGGGVVAGVNLKKSFAHQSGWIVITFGWGLGVAMAVYAVGGISGAHLNPAVTFGLALNGEFAWSEVPVYLVAQMIGAVIGAALVYLQYLPHWKATEDQGAKLQYFRRVLRFRIFLPIL